MNEARTADHTPTMGDQPALISLMIYLLQRRAVRASFMTPRSYHTPAFLGQPSAVRASFMTPRSYQTPTFLGQPSAVRAS
jgi:hypothetical protein